MHRVKLALETAKLDYVSYDINLMQKPEWFLKLNPEGTVRRLRTRDPTCCLTCATQVPVLLYGGTPCAPDSPSPDATVVVESLAILEFLADVHPSVSILPQDAAARATVRSFIAVLEDKFVGAYRAAFFRGEPKSVERLLDAVGRLQKRMPAEGYACGEWGMADIAAAPFLVRTWMMLENDLGKYPEGEGKKAWKTLTGDAEFARIAKYVEALKAHPAVKKTWDEVSGRALPRRVTYSQSTQVSQLQASSHYPGLLRGHPIYHPY